MLSLYLAGEHKTVFKILDSDLLFISPEFQHSLDVNCHPTLQQII